MNSLRRIIIGGVAAVATWVASAGHLLAQNVGKPAVVISIASADKLLADVAYLTRAAGVPEVGGLVTLMAGPNLQGFDTRRPAGVLLQFAGPMPTGVAFLPITNLDQVVKQLEGHSIEAEDAGGGIKKIQLQRPIYFKSNGGWVFVSDAERSLSNLPADPVASLGGLADKYSLAVQVNVRNIDPSIIDMAVSELKAGFDRSLEAETDQEKRQLQERVGRQSMESFVRLLQESDQLTVGWGVDSQARKTFLDFGLTAVAGTKLAQQMAGYDHLKSSFAGLQLPDAAASLRFTMPVAKEELEQAREALKTMREQALKAIDDDQNLPTDAARRAAKQIVGALADVLVATVEAGKLDGGAALVLGPKSIELIAGGFVADGMAIQTQLKKLAELSKQSGQNGAKIDDVKFNVAKHQGIDFHSFSVPVPEDEEHARKVLGERIKVMIGTGPKNAYLAFGEGSANLIKRVIDVSAASAQKDVTPMELYVSLTPILEFAAAVENDPVVKLMAESVKGSSGKDHLRLTQKAVERGVTARLEVEEGVLQLIGVATKARNNLGN